MGITLDQEYESLCSRAWIVDNNHSRYLEVVDLWPDSYASKISSKYQNWSITTFLKTKSFLKGLSHRPTNRIKMFWFIWNEVKFLFFDHDMINQCFRIKVVTYKIRIYSWCSIQYSSFKKLISSWLRYVFLLILAKDHLVAQFCKISYFLYLRNYHSRSIETFPTPVPIYGKAPKYPKPLL